MASSDRWKHFERLVKAIHQAADQGADVRWDETINGRQFDVTVRFKRGLYEYLTVVECKNVGKPVSVEKVDAFVTKADDVKADRAVLASTAGFQKGAKEVAVRHNMTLIHITQSSDVDLSVFQAEWAGVANTPHIKAIELEYTDGEKKRLPEEANGMTYYVKKTLLQCGVECVNLETILQLHGAALFGPANDAYRESRIPCPPGTHVIGPDDGVVPLKPIACIHVHAGIMQMKQIKAPRRFDPCLLVPPVKVKDIATGEETTFDPRRLAVGFDTKLEQGKFYEHPYTPSFYYYCNQIEGDMVTLYLVESFQLGMLVQAAIQTNTEYQKFYIPVTDKSVLQRLKQRLETYRFDCSEENRSFSEQRPPQA